MEVRQTARAALVRIGALAGILVALTIIINLSWFDEALDPDLERLLPAQPVSMQDNAYPLIYGLMAAPDRDIREVGLAIVAKLRERYRDGERVTLTDQELDEFLGDRTPEEVGVGEFASFSCNSRFELDCADRLIDELRRADVERPGLPLLLGRYESVLGMPRFEENQEFDAWTPLPSYGELTQLSRIRLALAYLNEPTTQFLDSIAADVRLWRTMLADGQSLVAKMIALAGLRNDMAFLSTLMRGRALGSDELMRISRIAAPLTEDERDIGETFLAELRISLLSSKSFAVLLDGPPSIYRLAQQDNATINEFYRHTITPLRLRAKLRPDEFYREHANAPIVYNMRVVPPPLYNLGGKLVLRDMSTDIGWTDYISRVHDLGGRIELVLLQAEIAANPGRNVADVVRASVHRNPYTLEPMDYDSASNMLSFECLGIGGDLCGVRIR